MVDQRAVVVLGAGVVGVATAFFLAHAGHQVTVLERREGAGLETSFANGGLITPSMSDPWAAPGVPLKLLKWMGRENSRFLVRPAALPGLLGWGFRFARQCGAEAWRRNTETILRLSRFSQRCLREVTAQTGIDYRLNCRGTLHLFRDQLSMDSALRVASVLEELGVTQQNCNSADCVRLEPALAGQQHSIVGAIHYPDDEAGDAHLFTQALAKSCVSLGVEFRYSETIQQLRCEHGKLQSVMTDKGNLPTTCCIVALGNHSARLLRPQGIKLPIYPVKGYSLTIPVQRWESSPQLPFVDDARKIAIVRMGDEIRVAGTAEFTGFSSQLNQARIVNLKNYFQSVFPDCASLEQAHAWQDCGLPHPMEFRTLGARQ